MRNSPSPSPRMVQYRACSYCKHDQTEKEITHLVAKCYYDTCNRKLCYYCFNVCGIQKCKWHFDADCVQTIEEWEDLNERMKNE